METINEKSDAQTLANEQLRKIHALMSAWNEKYKHLNTGNPEDTEAWYQACSLKSNALTAALGKMADVYIGLPQNASYNQFVNNWEKLIRLEIDAKTFDFEMLCHTCAWANALGYSLFTIEHIMDLSKHGEEIRGIILNYGENAKKDARMGRIFYDSYVSLKLS